MSKPWKDADKLREKYVVEGLTTREIADEWECSNGTVSRWLNKHDIETRDNWSEGVKAAANSNRVERVKMRTHERGYEYWSEKVTYEDGRKMEIVYVHRLLAIAEHGFDAVCGKVVHHKNRVPWDNRPENIEVMTRTEHQNEHRVDKKYRSGGFIEADKSGAYQ